MDERQLLQSILQVVCNEGVARATPSLWVVVAVSGWHA